MNWLLFTRKKCLIIFGQNFEIQMTVDSESAVAHCTPVVSADWVEKHGCFYVQKKKVVSNSNNLLQRFEKCCQNLAKNPLITVRVINLCITFVYIST